MIEPLIEITNVRIILALTMLGIASYTDVTKREINDLIWIVFSIMGIILLFLEPEFMDAVYFTLISLLVAPFVLLIWRLGLFGGADAFAIISLAILAPQISIYDNMISPFTVLTNAVIFSIIPMFVNLSRNLILIVQKKDVFEGFSETKSRRILAMFIGYKASNPKYCFSIEKKVGKKKKLNLSLQHAEYAEFCSTPNTWVTPGIPYMLFILGGFATQLFYGDVIFSLFGLFT